MDDEAMTTEERQSKKLDEISTQLVDVRVTLAGLAAEVKAANCAVVSAFRSSDARLEIWRELRAATWLLVSAPICADSSAMGTNSAGLSMPSVGCSQRTSASKPASVSVGR